MKVKNINASSIKTDIKIKKAFAELMKEKKSLNKITVTELVKRADITRSAFYTHYDDIYDIANEYQEETLQMLKSNENNLYTINDIFNFFDSVIILVKQNENIYRMLLTSNEPLIFIEKLKKIIVEKIYKCLLLNNCNNKYLKLHINVYLDGILIQILRYFRETNFYSLDEINENSKEIFKKLFLK